MIYVKYSEKLAKAARQHAPHVRWADLACVDLKTTVFQVDARPEFMLNPWRGGKRVIYTSLDGRVVHDYINLRFYKLVVLDRPLEDYL